VNTGGGGGGAGFTDAAGGAGGSGIVIFSIPVQATVSFSGGVTSTSTTIGPSRVYSVTAAGPTDTVTIG
jgi:hypothetical protein